MNYKFLILLLMVFCHIIDDYYLQGWLALAKQISWWEKNAPERLYKKDYLVALFMHSFSWTFMIMLVPTFYIVMLGGFWSITIFVINMVVHMIVDDLKANKKKINLIQEQSIHILQVIATWFVLVMIN